MAYRSIIRFRVKPGMDKAFEAAFAQCGMLARPSAIDGFVMAELVRSVSEPVEYFVLGEWTTQQAYADWQAISHIGADPVAVAALNETLIEFTPGRLFQPVSRS